jgi:PAS domain S-box-containing protein
MRCRCAGNLHMPSLPLPTRPLVRTPGGELFPPQRPIRRRRANWKPASLVLVLIAGCCLAQPAAPAPVKEVRRVLILNVMGPLSSPGVALLDGAIVAGLQESPYQIELYTENLEATLFPDESSQQQFRESYIRKYRDRKPDVIIAVGLEPLRFMIESHESFFPNTPIVFCGSTEEMLDKLKLDSHFTGVWAVPQPEETLKAALALQPGTRHVVVTGGVGAYDRYLEAIARESFRKYESRLDFTYLTDLAMPALVERLKQLPDHTIVYHTSIMQDAEGTRFIDASQSVPMIASAARAPVFVVDEVDLGKGTIGGSLVSFAKIGQETAQMTMRALNGEKPQDIPIVKSANVYMFDWRALKRWGLKKSELPPGSLLLNYEATGWELYKWYIIDGIVLLLFQTLLILGLLRQRDKRRNAEIELKITNDRLRRSVEAGKCVGWDWDIRTGYDRWFGDLETVFGIPSHTYYGRVEDFRQRIFPDDRELVWKAVADSRKSREPYVAEFRVMRLDGTVRWITARGQFYYGANGDAERMLGMAVDITERKQAEEALKKSEEKFATAFQQSPLALTVTTLNDHRYLDVNETFEKMTGWQRNEVIGRTPFDINLWVDPSERSKMVKEVRAKGTVRNIDVHFHCKNGDARVALGSIGLIEIEGEPCLISVIADITDRRQIQEELRASEARLAGIVGSAMDAIIATDEEQNIVLFNTAAEKVFGCTAAEAIGTAIERFIPERFRSAHRAHMDRFGESGDASRRMTTAGTLRGLRASGEEFPIESTVSHLRTNGHQLFTVVVRDVTERYRSDEALRRSEQRLHQAIQAGRMYADEWDAVTNTIVRSPECVDILGTDQPLHTSPHELLNWIHPDDRDEFAGELAGITLENPSTTLRYRFQRSDGRTIWLEKSSRAFFDDKGTLQRVVGVIADITERKQAEQALRESEGRFRLVANTAPVLIWMSGTDKLCTYFNQPWLEFTGRPLEAELGNGWVEGVHPEDLAACMDTYTQAFDRREPFQMEYRLRRHDGEYRWVSDMGVARFNPDRSFAGYIGSCIDVTDRKVAEESMASMGRRLIEAHEEERTWIARELHDDINQRIALLAIKMDQWNHLPGSSADTHNHIQNISQNLSEIGKDVQALSHRLHSSKLEYLGLVAAAKSFCKELSEQHQVQIDFNHSDIPRNLPKEIALCLFRVLQEALQNGVKYSEVRHFKVEFHSTPSDIELSVSDTGVGFDWQDAINQRGLGLISMRERVQLVNGDFSIRSERGQGTTISARVPLGAVGSQVEDRRLRVG